MGITRSKVIALTVGMTAILTLAACDEGGQFNLGERLNLGGQDRDIADGADGATSARARQQDVEAPEVFSVTAAGLWDGRPSLGGIWVAHPEVEEPERVIIRNPSNGQSVVGALFRRERDNPGTELQISSDAAEALGMVAGTPQELEVTALRRADLPADDPAAEDTDPEEADAVPPPADVSETALDPLAEATPGTSARGLTAGDGIAAQSAAMMAERTVMLDGSGAGHDVDAGPVTN